MIRSKIIPFLSVIAFPLFFASKATALEIEIAEPSCPYGYYDSEPYRCAPYGYYGPEWFKDGAFIGAGRWFRGEEGFRGHVDNRFHPDHGYRGAYPEHGDARFNHFRGNEMRDGRGNIHGVADADGDHGRGHDNGDHNNGNHGGGHHGGGHGR